MADPTTPGTPTNPSPCCKAALAYETIGGMLVHREGHYACRCTKCGRSHATKQPKQPTPWEGR